MSSDKELIVNQTLYMQLSMYSALPIRVEAVVPIEFKDSFNTGFGRIQMIKHSVQDIKLNVELRDCVHHEQAYNESLAKGKE